MERAHGIDVNHFRRVLDWDQVASQGFEIFGAKATNGTATDEAFAVHRDGARQLPFDLVAYYHFPTPRTSALAQAGHLVDVVTAGGLRPNERIALDVEWDARNQWCPDLRFVDEFVHEATRLIGDRRMFLYTSAGVWSQRLGGPSWPGAIATDLWVPRYNDGSNEPALPRDAAGFLIWPRWTMWQDGETFSCPGVDGPCDHNVWRGDRADLQAWVLGRGAAV
jgi:GH25 family lysozyme M1 (1,4-beta-N-acetylmuramidase)